MSMRFSMLIFFLLLTSKAIAPDTRAITIFESHPVDLYEKLIEAIIHVESSGDTMAYNPFEDAYGPLQIRPIRLLDYNQRTGKEYKMKDCYRPAISKEIFLYYAKAIGYPNYEMIAKRWNGSGKKTLEYWEKVKAHLRIHYGYS